MAQRFSDWQIEDWAKVIWTDEAAFNVGGSPGRVFVTRNASEEFDSSCLLPRFKKLSTIHVWGCFFGTTKGPLVFWDKSTMGKRITASGYCQYTLPHLEEFWYECSRNTEDYVYILQDGASVHTANYTTRVLKEKGLYNYLFPWVAKSPDLNLIEGVWRLMKARINRRLPRPDKNDLMRDAIREEWENITTQDLESLLTSMPTRIQALIRAQGGHTKY